MEVASEDGAASGSVNVADAADAAESPAVSNASTSYLYEFPVERPVSRYCVVWPDVIVVRRENDPPSTERNT